MLSHAYNMSALILLAFKGSKRIAYNNTAMLLYTTLTATLRNYPEPQFNLKHKDKWLVTIFKQYMTNFFKESEIKDLLEGKDFWLTPKDMLERGIISKVK